MYDYLEAMKADIKEWIDDNKDSIDKVGDLDELKEQLNDDLWADDDVTGNGSDAGYPMDDAEMREAVHENSELCKDALLEFGTSSEKIAEKFLEGDYVYFDATIRCYLLGQAIDEVVNENEEEYEKLFVTEE
jgi:hypothetical protein